MRRLAIIVLLPCAICGQSFDSAIVRLSPPTSTASRMVNYPDRFEFLYCSVRSLLGLAYQVNAANIRGPEWITSEAIDVIAEKPPGATDEDQRQMLQALLADRFKLVLHRDSYDLTAYKLVVAESGVKVKAPASDVMPKPPNIYMKGPARILKAPVSMEQLAVALQLMLESPVTDSTGLKGTFDVLLQWSPEYAIAAELPDATFPPLPKALEQQLGLKLEVHKVTVDTLVVDSGQPAPTHN